MTGFGLGDAPFGRGRLLIEARTVNGRYLEVRIRAPRDLLDHAAMLEQEVRKRLSRGRCEIGVRIEGTALEAPTFDLARARSVYEQLARLRDELAPGTELPLTPLAAIPELFRSPLEGDYEKAGAALSSALARALDELERTREAEGRGLALDLGRRLDQVEKLLGELEARAPEATHAHARRLRERLKPLLSEGSLPSDSDAANDSEQLRTNRAGGPTGLVDAGRLERELVLWAERNDVSEELTRLRIHIARMREYLASSEPGGRRLDFLLQEMTREINTVGAKSQDAVIAHAVVELKAEFERMREQIQNVE